MAGMIKRRIAEGSRMFDDREDNRNAATIPPEFGVDDYSAEAPKSPSPANVERKKGWGKPVAIAVGVLALIYVGVRIGEAKRGAQAKRDQTEIEGQMLTLSHRNLLPNEITGIHIDPDSDIATIDIKAKGHSACSAHVEIDPEGQSITYSLYDAAGEQVAAGPDSEGKTATNGQSMDSLIKRIAETELDC